MNARVGRERRIAWITLAVLLCCALLGCHHHCAGEFCPVCGQLRQPLDHAVCPQAAVAAVVRADAVLPAAGGRPGMRAPTLVRLKTELLD